MYYIYIYIYMILYDIIYIYYDIIWYYMILYDIIWYYIYIYTYKYRCVVLRDVYFGGTNSQCNLWTNPPWRSLVRWSWALQGQLLRCWGSTDRFWDFPWFTRIPTCLWCYPMVVEMVSLLKLAWIGVYIIYIYIHIYIYIIIYPPCLDKPNFSRCRPLCFLVWTSPLKIVTLTSNRHKSRQFKSEQVMLGSLSRLVAVLVANSKDPVLQSCFNVEMSSIFIPMRVWVSMRTSTLTQSKLLNTISKNNAHVPVLGSFLGLVNAFPSFVTNILEKPWSALIWGLWIGAWNDLNVSLIYDRLNESRVRLKNKEEYARTRPVSSVYIRFITF